MSTDDSREDELPPAHESKAEQDAALFESEQRFRLLVQGVRDAAIYMLDTTGRVSNWNAGAELIKGYSADEIVGQHFSRFYTEEDRAAGEPEHALATALNEGKYEREAWRVRKDGTLFWAHVLIDPIYNEDGEHVGFTQLDLREIVSYTTLGNLRSQAVMKRLGMQNSGEFEHPRIPLGSPLRAH